MSGETKTPSPSDRRLYGRGAGRPLSARRQELVETLLPNVGLPSNGLIDPAALFPAVREARLEIGFGGGEHLIGQARANPDVGFIGVEPFIEGVGKALALIDDAVRGRPESSSPARGGGSGRMADGGGTPRAKLPPQSAPLTAPPQAGEQDPPAGAMQNVRLHRGDGREVIERITDESLAVVYVLFPDPWPKTRHWKRRIIQPAFVTECARVLTPGGTLRVATDVKSYVDWTLRHVRANPAFAWTARRPSDWREPPADHVTTRYESKNIGDCAPVYLDFAKPR